MTKRICDAKIDFTQPIWDIISENAKHFIKKILVVDPNERITYDKALKYKFITSEHDESIIDCLIPLEYYQSNRKITIANEKKEP